MFKARTARRSLSQYRKKGLPELEREMLAGVPAAGLAGARVLEIGGGIGALQAELLTAGAARGEIVELVASYEPYAIELARDLGLEGRVTYRVADVLEDENVDPADVVLLNRVVCCSPDGIELTGAAARLTRQTLVLSFPRDGFWMRVGIRLVNAGQWLLRRSFRVFLHPPAALVAAAEGEGLRLTQRGGGGLWEFAAFHRSR
jgi:magnesium-protoporphyrin O-methyltransferase